MGNQDVSDVLMFCWPIYRVKGQPIKHGPKEKSSGNNNLRLLVAEGPEGKWVVSSICTFL